MKLVLIFIACLLLPDSIYSLGIPWPDVPERSVALTPNKLPVFWKRRGGGGNGAKGGSGGGSGGRGNNGGGGGGSSLSRTSSSSNSGGATRSGSGPPPAYGGGVYYAGGARSPYTSGSVSPLGIMPSGVLPVAALAFFPGLWLYMVYAYSYNNPYYYVDQATHGNTSIPVVCLCEAYMVCGCDNNNNTTYYESLFNGTQPTNSNVVRIVEVNGTRAVYINGTLPNGTTVADESAPSCAVQIAIQTSGYWLMIALVANTVWG
ncbi:hypothetical protein BDV25DRAFT_58044 [Aspergillus avenaceus]|uniref:DUF7732 domain-containing protein n=1 Tax=Aspergillus avenaceus TaxID=36643 RepID=A0A5N6TI75_ASPAV|nr:hypothetical protein BDV25DRAFT_58044 [Aspergillus avenaceus]